MAKIANTKRTRHAVYNINYHFVWCPKYRYKVLQGSVAARLTELLFELVDAMTGNMLELVVQPDHIHLFVSFPPRMAPSDIINKLKGATSRQLRLEFPWLKSYLPTLWTRSYYVGTAGHVSVETIKQYIKAQEYINAQEGDT